MSQVIRISDQAYRRLEAHAQGFDTPGDVIERLLDHCSPTQDGGSIRTTQRPSLKAGRDQKKYIFNGEKYGKGRLVLAVVTAYVKDRPNISFAELRETFSKEIQGSLGVFCQVEDAPKKCTDPERRFFMKCHERIQLSDCEIVVCTQWGAGYNDNIARFLENAKRLGCTITSATNG